MSMNHQLQLTPEEMRRFGYRIVDEIAGHLTTLPEQPATHTASHAELVARLSEPPPEHGMALEPILEQLRRDVWSNIGHTQHPRFFAFIPSPSNFVSVMAEALIAGFNPFAGNWLEASGPAQLEAITIEWLRVLCGLPAGTGGHFVTGGSMANLTALATARHVRLDDQITDAMIYCSDQTHSSLERALKVLGFKRGQLRKLPSDDSFRLPLDALQVAVAADRASGLKPFCVIANAGTTNTGAIDPLPELAALCRAQDLWLHVDGAYGAAAALCPRGQALLQGLAEADSLTLDPHKWLFQPYEIGGVLVRERRWLAETFRVRPDYLKDLDFHADEINFCDEGLQLTRNFRALKLWLSFKTFGVAAFRAALEHGLAMAELAEQTLRTDARWQITSPATLGIVTFRFAPAAVDKINLNELNQRLVNQIGIEGFALVSSTVLRGQTVLRMCPINPRTTPDDIQQSIARMAQSGEALLDS